MQNWKERLSAGELKQLENLKAFGFSSGIEEDPLAEATKAIQYSLDHHLERKSVATDKEIVATALKSSIGQTGFGDIQKAFAANGSIIAVKEKGQLFITTKEALREENNLIANGYTMKGRFRPINENYQPVSTTLTDEQKNAISHALSTNDGIVIIAGKAGTGKTTLMREVRNGIERAGKEIHAFAPSAEASRVVQRSEGFENAETLASLFQNKELQAKLKTSVLWVDEAGMLSNREMNGLFAIAKEHNARIILTGDTKQHSSVERGDALRTLQQEAGITSIQVSKVQRQKLEWYKQAVEWLSKSDLQRGFGKLDKSGAIKEIENPAERLEAIANEYVHSTFRAKKPKQVLVVSPTHAEGEKVTEAIRGRLKAESLIGKEERIYQVFKNLQLTEAVKTRSENYQPGNWLVFHKKAIGGFQQGGKYQIIETEDNSLLVKDKTGKHLSVSLDNAKRFQVFEAKEISLSQGDKIRITGNGKAEDGKHLFNGGVYQVSGFDKEGNLKLSNDSTLSKDYGHFGLGYVVTSHSSQGKTVDKVIISQSSMSFRASSREQFYVSVSRRRQAVSIYTDNKADLLNAVSQSGERMSATELMRKQSVTEKMVDVTRLSLMQRIRERAIATAQKLASMNKSKDIGYGL